MFIPRLFILTFLFVLTACNHSQPDIPGYVLPPDKFAELIKKHALAESAAGVNINNVKATELDSVYAFDPLAETGVSQALYDSTVRFYTLHPDLYKKVYEQVLNDLSVMESSRDGVKADSAAK